MLLHCLNAIYLSSLSRAETDMELAWNITACMTIETIVGQDIKFRFTAFISLLPPHQLKSYATATKLV